MVPQPWREVEASLLNLMGKKICLSPFQCNKALFVCQNVGEATKIAQLGTFSMSDLKCGVVWVVGKYQIGRAEVG